MKRQVLHLRSSIRFWRPFSLLPENRLVPKWAGRTWPRSGSTVFLQRTSGLAIRCWRTTRRRASTEGRSNGQEPASSHYSAPDVPVKSPSGSGRGSELAQYRHDLPVDGALFGQVLDRRQRGVGGSQDHLASPSREPFDCAFVARDPGHHDVFVVGIGLFAYHHEVTIEDSFFDHRVPPHPQHEGRPGACEALG